MYHLTVEQHFDAAHHLVGYRGKCQRNHGHRFLVQTTVEGAEVNNLGMLIDFGEVKTKVDFELEKLDHWDLNTITPFDIINPTAENIASYLYYRLQNAFGKTKLTSVKIYESPECYIEFNEE